MSSRNRDRWGTRAFARGFVRIPRRRRGKPNPIARALVLLLIGLALAGVIARRVVGPMSPRYVRGHSPEYRYRQLAPDENLLPDDNRRLDQTIRDRSRD